MAAADKLEALRMQHAQLTERHTTKCNEYEKVHSELGLTRDELQELMVTVKGLRGNISLLRSERNDAQARAKEAQEALQDFKAVSRRRFKEAEEAAEAEILSQQTRFVREVAEHEQECAEKLQRHIDEAKHMHDALNTLR